MIELPKTRYRIAKELGISKQAVSQWFLGITLPTEENLIRLAECLDMTVDEVFKLLEGCTRDVVPSDGTEDEVIQ